MFNFLKPTGNSGPGLKIIIVGCGKVGTTLIERLSKEGHDITVIDMNEATVKEISGTYDVMGIVGNGANFSVQNEAGIESADLIIAVTESDELNLLCCTIAKRTGDCAAIARVRTPDYSTDVGYLRDQLGLAMIINPEMEAAAEASRILYVPAALDVNAFAHGQAELIRFELPEGTRLDGLEVYQLRKMLNTDILVCGVERGEDVFIPGGNFVLKGGDIISFVATRKQALRFLTDIGFQTDRVKNCMIVGGGKCAYYLSKMLLGMGIEVKIIEKSKTRCEELSILLPKAIIINGDGTDQELLEEEGISYTESFVPLTGIDEENILLTLYAKKVSNAKVITKINRINFRGVINSLNLGSVIYPRYITSEAIIAYVRAKKNSTNNNIETLYHMFDHRAEAIEFNVTDKCKFTGVPLKNLNLKKDLLICFINRNGKIIIPNGDDMIMSGDTVMIVTKNEGFECIEDVLV